MDEMWGEAGFDERAFAGKTYYMSGDLPPMAGYWPDDRTVVLADEPTLRAILSSAGKVESPLARRLRGIGTSHDLAVVIALEPVRDHVAVLVEEAEVDGEQAIVQLMAAAQELDALSIVADLEGDPMAEVVLDGRSAEKAVEIEKLAIELREMGRQMTGAYRGTLPPDEQAALGPLLDLAGRALEGVAVARDERRVTVTLARPKGLDEAVPTLLAGAQEAARRGALQTQRMNNLKWIGLAMHHHAAHHGSFPPAVIRDEEGKPLYSWRVAILPFLEEAALYDQFDREKPWDSSHNVKLIEQMPEVFLTPGDPNDGKTRYVVFTGEGTPFGLEEGPGFAQIRDGTSNTIMVVEAGPDKAVEWTRPQDLTYNSEDPVAALGEVPDDTFPALFCDGSVRMIAVDLDAEVLRCLIQHADGQPIPNLP
jgi:hypothetical protein